MSISYPVSIHQRLYSLVVVPLLVLVVIFLVIQVLGKSFYHPSVGVSLNYILLALMATYARLLVAFVLALVVSLPLAVLISKSSKAERILLPMFDIIQSVPVLAFFPVVIVFFVHYNFFDGAAVFI